MRVGIDEAEEREPACAEPREGSGRWVSEQERKDVRGVIVGEALDKFAGREIGITLAREDDAVRQLVVLEEVGRAERVEDGLLRRRRVRSCMVKVRWESGLTSFSMISTHSISFSSIVSITCVGGIKAPCRPASRVSLDRKQQGRE